VSARIHPTAIVHRGAELGHGVEVGPYSVIGANVVIADNCRIHHYVTIDGHTTLGEQCQVFPQAVLGTPPQDLKYRGEPTTLEIGRRNIFREMVTVHPGTANGGGRTVIGDDNLLLIGVHVAHDCRIGNHCIIANYVQFAGHVHVEDYANMGGHSSVHHFVTIGKHAFVGGATRIATDVPPFMIVVAARGSRAEVRMVNGVGLQRCGYAPDEIQALKDAYMTVFSRRARLSGVGISERIQALLATDGINPHVKYLCEFLMRSFIHGRHGRFLESRRNDPVHRDSWTLDHRFNLTLNVIGRGSVERVISRRTKDKHEVLQLTARAEPGWGFAGWNGGLSGDGNPVDVLLDSNKTVTATFVPQSA
jgi:UDP-N-acetylglucosamine acyltransferase